MHQFQEDEDTHPQYVT